jgi:hypothetical protein
MTGDAESTTRLSAEDRTKLSNVIWENVFGEEPIAKFIDALIEKNPLLIAEGAYWGFSDTLVREQVVSCCSTMLIGRSWPTYGDGLSDKQMETFIKDLKKSYDEWINGNSK